MAFRQVTGYFLPGDEREGYPLISYAPDAEPWELVEEFQKLLNACGPKQIEVNGVPGQETSDAFKELTGYYLYGDPRRRVDRESCGSGWQPGRGSPRQRNVVLQFA